MDWLTWPAAFLFAVAMCVALATYIFARIFSTRADVTRDVERLTAEVYALSKRVASFPAADEFLADIAELEKRAQELERNHHLLLTREGAERMVESVNKLTEDFVPVKEFFDMLHTKHQMRTSLLDAED